MRRQVPYQYVLDGQSTLRTGFEATGQYPTPKTPYRAERPESQGKVMPIDTRIVLAGGGDTEDSRPLDELFAAWTGPSGRMLFLPVALDGLRHDRYLETIRSEFTPLGVSKIEMWTDLLEHDANELAAFDSIYLGGGSTFRLLARLRDSGFDNALVSYARQGGAIYGCSAGADVLGRDIMTAAHDDSNDVGLTETHGLDLVAGHAVWCHYRPDIDALVVEYVQERGIPVLAISERSGVTAHGDRLASVGFDPVYRFDEDGKQELRTPD